jgi:hypothetical protein
MYRPFVMVVRKKFAANSVHLTPRESHDCLR